MSKIKFFVFALLFGVFVAIILYPPASLACTGWVQQDSTCVYGNSQDGNLWTRSCPDTVCHRDGRFITNIPCDNEEICMPKSSLDGPTLPGTDTQLPVETDPNQLDTVCQKWYPITDNNAQSDGCSENQVEWTRACQKYDPQNYPTQACSANYPADN